MVEVYEIKPNGFLGQTKLVDPREGVDSGWTYLQPPGDGPHKWKNSQWFPCEAEPVWAAPLPNLDYLGDVVRQERNTRIAATDWTQGKDIPDYVSAAWAPYRQALRDITSQADFPLSVQWPEQPSVVKPEPVIEPVIEPVMEPEPAVTEPVVTEPETTDNTSTETPPEVL